MENEKTDIFFITIIIVTEFMLAINRQKQISCYFRHLKKTIKYLFDEGETFSYRNLSYKNDCDTT